MIDQCEQCSSDRMLEISGKVDDKFSAIFKGVEYNGYVPHSLGIGGGDYIAMHICLDCGKVYNILLEEDPEFFTNSKP